MRSYLSLAAAGLLLAGSGCAQEQASNTPRTSHYAMRSNRIGSNIPQPYDASADRGDAITTQDNVARLSQQGNTVGNMQSSFGGH